MFVLFVFLILKFVSPSEKRISGCVNGIKDSGETGIDCGGNCASCIQKTARPPIVVRDPKIFENERTYQVLTRIKNPNSNAALELLEYELVLYGLRGNEVSRSRREVSLSPAEDMYFLDEFEKGQSKVSKADINFTAVVWREGFESDNKLQLQAELVYDVSDKLQVSGEVKNGSNLDYDSVEVIVIAMNQFRTPVGASKTRLTNLRSGDSRSFTVNFEGSYDLALDRSKTEVWFYTSAQ